jgi:hypothetical protein
LFSLSARRENSPERNEWILDSGLPDGLFSNQKSHLEKKLGPHIGKCWYILRPFGIFSKYLGYFMTIRYILCSFGTFIPVLVPRTKKNLATLHGSAVIGRERSEKIG